jgi:uncharacterized membrane-anchored protein YjiN (DUF445 family)
MLTPQADQKKRALRRMKMIATGAFLFMTAVFFITERFGTGTIFWVVRWDHINAFAEASMVGALADWFAVVALFKHPLGLPIWHTAIIPRKKDEIGRNLGAFVETRLLSMETLSREVGNFSASTAVIGFLSTGENRERASGWLADAIASMVRALDDDQVETMIRDMAARQLKNANASRLMGSGLEMIASSGKHNELLDQALRQVAVWVPSRRDMIEEFIERALRKMLRWGSKLVPGGVVDRATDQVLDALIDLLQNAASDPYHPLRKDFSNRVAEWTERLKSDPEWIARVDEWKNEIIEYPELRSYIAGIWAEGKEWILGDLEKEDSTVRSYALRAIESLHTKLENDPELRATIDDRLRHAAISFLSTHHHAIGSLIQRVIDSWDSQQLSEELELNLGKDLQYIRLNGTFIGGLVGLVIHLVR